MGKKTARNHKGQSTIHWISPSNLPKLKVKSHEYTGGCKSVPYVITEDGELYLLRKC